MVSPHHIKYAGVSSDELNLLDLIMCAAIDGDNGETNSYLNRSAIQSESHDGRYKPTIRYKYDEVFEPKFTFLKKNFEDFSMDEIRILLKYLTSKDTTALLEVFYDDSNSTSWCAIGGWTEINLQKLANNRTIGVTAVFSAIHPFALSDLYTVTKKISDPTDNKIVINIDTDDNQPVYPRITIEHHGSVINVANAMTSTSDMVYDTVYYDGTHHYWKPTSEQYKFKESQTNPNLSTTSVRFTNTHTDFFNVTKTLKSTVVKNNNTTERIILDGANRIISSNSENRIFGDDFVEWRWLALHDGKNEITVEGNCTVTLEWREPRKVGEW